MKSSLRSLLMVIAIIMIVSASISAIIFSIQHPDMTEMRMLIEHPWPTVVGMIGILIGCLTKRIGDTN